MKLKIELKNSKTTMPTLIQQYIEQKINQIYNINNTNPNIIETNER